MPAVTHTVEDAGDDLSMEAEENANRCTPHSESIVREYRREVQYIHVQWSANRNAQLTDARRLMNGSLYVHRYYWYALYLLSISIAILAVEDVVCDHESACQLNTYVRT